MRKLLFAFILLASCSSPSLEGNWTISNAYTYKESSPLESIKPPFEKMEITLDSVFINNEGNGFVSDDISGENHFIFSYQDTTRYFIIKELESDHLILETTSFYNAQKALLSFKR